jgi:hypothetical protein
MLIVIIFVSTRVVTVVENLVLSPQGRYRAGEVSLRKGATTLPSKPHIEQGAQAGYHTTVPKFIDPVLAKTSPKRSFLIIENERFGLVSRVNWSYKFKHCSPC